MPLREVVRQVRVRAGGRCEYCRFPQAAARFAFPIDHIRARQHGGTDDLDNPSVACGFCNGSKGPNLSGVDSRTNRLTRLFNPRRDRWVRHFEWSGFEIVGRTAVGRATVAVLAMNQPGQVSRRELVAADGRFTFDG